MGGSDPVLLVEHVRSPQLWWATSKVPNDTSLLASHPCIVSFHKKNHEGIME